MIKNIKITTTTTKTKRIKKQNKKTNICFLQIQNVAANLNLIYQVAAN